MKILVVVDMQNDFIDGVLGTKEAEAIVPGVAEKIKNHDGIIIVTQDTHHDNYLETQEGRNLPIKHCIKDTEGWKLNSSVENALKGKEVITVEKITFGSEHLPEVYKAINEKLSKNGDKIEEIEICGLCTDICVISNAMLTKAFLPEVPVVVDASCCAGVTPESHKNALEAMKVCQIKVINE